MMTAEFASCFFLSCLIILILIGVGFILWGVWNLIMMWVGWAMEDIARRVYQEEKSAEEDHKRWQESMKAKSKAKRKKAEHDRQTYD